jgi:hypothetical protein
VGGVAEGVLKLKIGRVGSFFIRFRLLFGCGSLRACFGMWVHSSDMSWIRWLFTYLNADVEELLSCG